jgi:hypothetical protein
VADPFKQPLGGAARVILGIELVKTIVLAELVPQALFTDKVKLYCATEFNVKVGVNVFDPVTNVVPGTPPVAVQL